MTGKMKGEILALLSDNPAMTIPELAVMIGKSESTVERILRELRNQKQLKRIGPTKGGHWEVIE